MSSFIDKPLSALRQTKNANTKGKVYNKEKKN